jgi:hypothetical protein
VTPQRVEKSLVRDVRGVHGDHREQTPDKRLCAFDAWNEVPARIVNGGRESNEHVQKPKALPVCHEQWRGRGSSISRMLTEQLDDLLEPESGYEQARKRSLATLDRGLDLGTNGRATWSRDGLHER